METVRLLLVEDNPVDALRLKDALEQATGTKFAISHVETLAEAKGLFEKEDFDVVVLDLGLPDSQGLTTFTQLQNSAPTTPIVVLSGLDDETLAMEAVRKGAQDYLLKDKLDGYFLSRSINYAIERKQAEKALRATQERFELALSGADLGWWEWNVQTGEAIADERSTQFTGYSPDEIESYADLWKSLVHPDDKAEVVAAFNKHLQGSTALFETEHRLRTKSEGWKWILVRGKTIERDPEGKPLRMAGTFLNITDRKKAEEALRASEERHVAELEQGIKERTAELVVTNEQLSNEIHERKQVESELQRSNAELQQFAYVASHDLQEPLRMISSYVQLLERRYKDKFDEDADEFITYAVDGAKRMHDLISGLLEYSRVGTHGKPFESIDCEAVLDRALANLQILLADSGAQVTRDPLPTLSADSVQLVQLFQNLIDNACKFRDDTTPQIYVSARLESGQWLFSVSDNGIGIDPEFAERIFIIFQRLHSREAFPGTGIGLAICKKIVERHAGNIWVESEPSVGTTFYFTIPENGVRT
jgi:PAS domain S-box-containing protein